MNILYNWDTSVTNAPTGFDVATFESDIEAAGSQISAMFSRDNITLTVNVGLGECGGTPMPVTDAGDGGPVPNTGEWMPYATVIQEMRAHTANSANLTQLSNLPSVAPTGLTQIYVADAQLKLWGLMNPASAAPDGQVGFASNLTYTSSANRAVVGEYDLQGIAFHEMTHALLDRTDAGIDSLATYTSPGALAPTAVPGYFSLNGGATSIGAFSGTDLTDWLKNGDADPLNLYTNPDTAETNISAADMAELNWLTGGNPAPPTPAPPPPPKPVITDVVVDYTTGQTTQVASKPYTGIPGITSEFITTSPHKLAIYSTTPNQFIKAAGFDAIDVHYAGGNNILDGGGGSNFLQGGLGNDTFYIEDTANTQPTWNTLLSFHKGDNATIWGVSPKDFALSWMNGQGDSIYKGLTLYITSATHPEAAVTITGLSTADLGRDLGVGFFHTATGVPYLELSHT
jgi:hypothetical protein